MSCFFFFSVERISFSSIIVERWLPYKQQKRRVIYQKAPPVQPPAPQKNLIIQWEGTQARVVKEFRNLGIVKADPTTYVQQYGPQLRPTQGLPDFVKGLPTPNLGPEYVRNIFFLIKKKSNYFFFIFSNLLLILIKLIQHY